MVNPTYEKLGSAPSMIRELFAYGLRRSAEVGPENVFDYSLGNPSIPAPQPVQQALLDVLHDTDPIQVHGYSMAGGFDGTRRAVAEEAGDGFRVRTRDELRASFYRIMTYEKWGIFFIALLVLIIASFSVVGALAMLIVEKRDDISTLRALGADTGLVRAVFRTEGFLICGLGAVAGMTLGVAATLAQQYFGLIEIPAETFLTKSYPVEFRPTDLAVVAASFAAVAALLSNITVRSMIKTDRL